ncbi:MAG: M20 family metallopeptidase [Desulfobulbaceae bacterium]|nr:M20 family metallopeptidase [Desulfobulbaceae bacterium]
MSSTWQHFLTEHEPDMFDLLRELVVIQSGTGNKTGVDLVGKAISKALDGLPLTCSIIHQDQYGDHLIFSTPAAECTNDKKSGKKSGEKSKQNILITGHMDTVFPEDTNFNGYREDDDKVYGPGVIDMKGGLVTTIFAVKALAASGHLADLPIVLLFNSDEEIGSPTSIPILQELATAACCALVTECGGVSGEVVTGRRGKCGYQLDITGRAGHAAFADRSKASSILELAHKTIALEALNDLKSGLVVNVGKVEGGIGPNTVAEHAAALIDTRYTSEADGISLRQEIEQICKEPVQEGTATSLSITNERPVMVPSGRNKKLYRIFKDQADLLKIPVLEEFRPGVSDANTLAGTGLAVLDGLGPVGEHDHSSKEYMIKDSLPQRCRLLAASILELSGPVVLSEKKLP